MWSHKTGSRRGQVVARPVLTVCSKESAIKIKVGAIYSISLKSDPNYSLSYDCGSDDILLKVISA